MQWRRPIAYDDRIQQPNMGAHQRTMRYRTTDNVKQLGYPVIDCHMHVRADASGGLDVQHCDQIIAANATLGITLSCIMDLNVTGPQPFEMFHRANDRAAAAVARHPGSLRAWCFVNPGDPRAMEEIEQRVRGEGFIGVKLYNQRRIDEAALDPILDRCALWGVPVLSHAGRPNDTETRARQPKISDASHFAAAAKKHPDTMLIEAHLGGGGDWEWALKYLRDAPSVYVDIAGSVLDEDMIDRAAAAIGASRLLFATDMTYEGSMAKALDADLSDEEFSGLMGRNFQKILDRRAI